MSNRKKDEFLHAAKIVLRRSGFSDKFAIEWTHDYTYFAVGSGAPVGIKFADQKEQFIYELNGGNQLFMTEIICEHSDLFKTDWTGPR